MAGISIREFARRDGCDDKLVRRAVAKGKLKAFDDGTLDENLVGTGWRKSNRNRPPADTAKAADTSADTSKGVRTVRDATGRQRVERGVAPTAPAKAPAAEPDAATLAEFIDRILSGDFAPLHEAEAAKENALALKHLLDGRQKAGELVALEVAKNVLFETSRAARDAWLNFPSKVGPVLAAELGVEADRLVEVLTPHVHRQLADLGDPDPDFTPDA